MTQLANLAWLLPVNKERLIVCGANASKLADAWDGMFGEAQYFEGSSLQVIQQALASHAHTPSTSADLFVLDVRHDELAERGEFASCLPAIKRLVKPGGWIVVLLKTAWNIPERHVYKAVKQVGNQTRRWYVVSSLDTPWEFVPHSRTAIAAWDGLTNRNATRQLARHAIIKAGLFRVLFSEVVIAAQV